MLRGAAAGAVGTLAMDLLWYSRHRREGGDDGFIEWEFSTGTTDWDEAGVPAKLGKRAADALLAIELPDSAAGLTNDVVHWSTGAQWGALYGLAVRSSSRVNPLSGALLGIVACSASYVVLPLAKLYKPIWEYDAPTLAKDLSAHLVYGVVTAEAFRLVARRGRVSRE